MWSGISVLINVIKLWVGVLISGWGKKRKENISCSGRGVGWGRGALELTLQPCKADLGLTKAESWIVLLGAGASLGKR